MPTIEAEATSLLDYDYQAVLFETDCKSVVDALASHSAPPQNDLGGIISQCKILLSSNNNYAVSFVRRQRLLIVWLEHPYLILAPCLQ
jgi:hypothetical protein